MNPNDKLAQALRNLIVVTQHLGPCPGTLEEARKALAEHESAHTCTCPSGDGSLRWPCPVHPPESEAVPTYHLTPAGHAAMGKALRSSVTILDGPAAQAPAAQQARDE